MPAESGSSIPHPTAMDRGLPAEGTRATPERAEFVLELPSDLRVIEAAVTYLVNRCRSYAFAGSRLTLNFRVGITEALANAVKHAQPSTVQVRLDEREGCVWLTVDDDGCGGAVPEGNGLRGLADRVEAVGGRLRVCDRRGGGTRVEAVVPCAS